MSTTTRTANSTSPSTEVSSSRPPLVLIFGLLLLRTVLLFIGDGVSYGIAAALDVPYAGPLVYANVTIVLVDLITVGAVIALQRRRGSTVRDLVGPIRPGRDLAWGLLVLLLAGVALPAGSFLGNLVVYQGPPPAFDGYSVPLWLALWSTIVMPVTIAVAEELSYRGYAQQAVAQRWGTVAAVLVPAAFFALQHAALSATGWDAMAARVIAMFITGIVFGLLRVWLKRLAPLIVGHWLLDVIGLGAPMMIVALG